MVEVDCAGCEQRGCCTFRGWKVFFLSEERERVALLYGDQEASKIAEFQSRKNGSPVYAVTLPCPFFEKDSGLCRVYDARPLVCRLFPLELEPITESLYLDQAVCPKRMEAKYSLELIQIDVKQWCDRFWQTSGKKESPNEFLILEDAPSQPENKEHNR
ncbi:MAG: YkgJ family cysteine cluster protein [Candidatus Binatia bacterium]